MRPHGERMSLNTPQICVWQLQPPTPKHSLNVSRNSFASFILNQIRVMINISASVAANVCIVKANKKQQQTNHHSKHLCISDLHTVMFSTLICKFSPDKAKCRAAGPCHWSSPAHQWVNIRGKKNVIGNHHRESFSLSQTESSAFLNVWIFVINS